MIITETFKNFIKDTINDENLIFREQFHFNVSTCYEREYFKTYELHCYKNKIVIVTWNDKDNIKNYEYTDLKKLEEKNNKKKFEKIKEKYLKINMRNKIRDF